MKLEFYSLLEDYSSIPSPSRSSEHIPAWFTSIKRDKSPTVSNEQLKALGMADFQIQELLKLRTGEHSQVHSAPSVKTCPGIIDWMKSGFVISAWTDFTIKIKGDDEIKCIAKDKLFDRTIGYLPVDQFVSHTQSDIKRTMSLYSPWYCKTPPGYSLMQLPLLYHFYPGWSCAAGMLSTDVYHSLNQQLLITRAEGTITISKGTPLAMYVPFKREDWEIEVREPTYVEVKNQEGVHEICASGPGKGVKMYRDMEKAGSRCPFMKIKNFLAGGS
jgi:hypothetical protein